MLTEQQLAKLDRVITDGMMPSGVQHAVSGQALLHGAMNQ